MLPAPHHQVFAARKALRRRARASRSARSARCAVCLIPIRIGRQGRLPITPAWSYPGISLARAGADCLRGM